MRAVSHFLQELDGGLTKIDEVGEEGLPYRWRQIVEQTQKRVPSSFTKLFNFHVSEDTFYSPMQQSGNFRFLDFNFLHAQSDERESATY